MPPIHRFELDWIVAIQGSGAFQKIMLCFSYPGSEALAYVLPFLYFCVSRRAGTRLYLLFSLTGPLLHIFKLTCHMPRPYWVDSRIKTLSSSGGYGMPSGHVLGATVVWLFLARTLGKVWIWLIAIALVLLVSVSRVYLGVHFISDVAAAWIIGAGLLGSFVFSERKLSERLKFLSLWSQILLAVWATACLLTVGLAVRSAIDGIVDPPEWSVYSAGARKLGGFCRSVGEFFGAACGIILTAQWACFEVRGAFWRRCMALGYALAGAWLIRELSKTLPSMHAETLQFAKTFLDGAVSNLWIVFLAPWLLLKAGLLQGENAGDVRTIQCVSGLEAPPVRVDP